ncbi:MAG: MFS transporter [Anaerolineaceae bacterium]|nr:MFS transporter [Anaerolineaceae bacterium]
MNNIFKQLVRLISNGQTVPIEFESNFYHLYLEITGFGVLNGSTIAFLAVYAARLGATETEIGLLTAVPAIVNLLFAMPAARLLEKTSTGKAVFWSSVLQRAFYLILIPLPFFLLPNQQIWTIVAITLMMSIPGTALAIGANALIGEAVVPEWRGTVVGIRNAFFSLATILTSLICGQILYRVTFPTGYEIVFAIGFLGAAFSCLHLGLVHPVNGPIINGPIQFVALTEQSERFVEDIGKKTGKARKWLVDQKNKLRLEILKGSYGKVITVLFAFHLFQYLSIPLFPIYMVQTVHFSDQIISLGNAMFYVTDFLGSMQLARVSSKLGNQKVTGLGVILLGTYPILLSMSKGLGMFLVTSSMGGIAWALAGGALYNYLLEKAPACDRPAHLAWYNLALNAAILIGSLSGPVISQMIGLRTALVIFGIGRFLAGVFVIAYG